MIDEVFVGIGRGLVLGGFVVDLAEVGDGGFAGVFGEGSEGFGGECQLLVIDGVFGTQLLVVLFDLVVLGEVEELGGVGVGERGSVVGLK